MSMDQPSVMIADRSMRYVRAMLLGQEIDLLIFNILIYSIVDIWFESAGISILITYLLDSAVNIIRGLVGKVFSCFELNSSLIYEIDDGSEENPCG